VTNSLQQLGQALRAVTWNGCNRQPADKLGMLTLLRETRDVQVQRFFAETRAMLDVMHHDDDPGGKVAI
jgi:hypothetical protein